MEPRLEEVFKTSGVPTYTFVEPPEYTKMLVALRTKGRSLIIEGPSGIGKTTCVQKAIDEVGLRSKVLILSTRKKEDKDIIVSLPDMTDVGIVIIDDFHILDDNTKESIANYIKLLADEEDENSKVIAVGINKAGDSLVKFAPDLNNRVDTIRFESNPDDKIIELIVKGESALNIKYPSPNQIAEMSGGSFHITQMICSEACIRQRVLEKEKEEKILK